MDRLPLNYGDHQGWSERRQRWTDRALPATLDRLQAHMWCSRPAIWKGKSDCLLLNVDSGVGNGIEINLSMFCHFMMHIFSKYSKDRHDILMCTANLLSDGHYMITHNGITVVGILLS